MDFTAEKASKLAADGKAQAGAAHAFIDPAARALEREENPAPRLGGHARAVILHLDRQRVVLPRHAHRGIRAFTGIFFHVRKQVRKDLRKRIAIEAQIALRRSIVAAADRFPLEQRREGFMDQMATKYPGFKIVADKYADGQASTGLNIMTDLITANPNLVGVFASNLIMAQGVGQAIAENKLGDKIKVIGFDSDENTVGFLKEGVLAGLVVQDPYRMGYDGIKTALAVSKGEKVEAFVDTGANLVTKDNMADPKIDALLNPKVN